MLIATLAAGAIATDDAVGTDPTTSHYSGQSAN
jgi:hypothetical protein